MSNQCKICSGDMSLIVHGAKDYFVKRGESSDFDIAFCSHCKIGFSFPDMSNDELSEYYPKNFEAYTKKSGVLAALQTMKYKQDLRFIFRHKKKIDSLYEIGAGRGEFLHIAKKKLGNAAYIEGSEPSSKGVENSNELFGINLEQGFAEALNFKQKYDVICMRHVLEHINDAKAVLGNIFVNGLTQIKSTIGGNYAQQS